MGPKARAIHPNIAEANTTVTRLTSCLPTVTSGNSARATVGMPTMALYDRPCAKLSITSGSDQAIGSARQTSPRIPLLCESAATKPRTGHTGGASTSQGRASRHPAKSPTDSRSANNPWYERSHARRYAAIVSAPSTPPLRSERLLRVAQTASTKPIVTHGAVLAPTVIGGPAICLRNCAVTPNRRPVRKAPARVRSLWDAWGRVAGRYTPRSATSPTLARNAPIARVLYQSSSEEH